MESWVKSAEKAVVCAELSVEHWRAGNKTASAQFEAQALQHMESAEQSLRLKLETVANVARRINGVLNSKTTEEFGKEA